MHDIADHTGRLGKADLSATDAALHFAANDDGFMATTSPLMTASFPR